MGREETNRGAATRDRLRYYPRSRWPPRLTDPVDRNWELRPNQTHHGANDDF